MLMTVTMMMMIMGTMIMIFDDKRAFVGGQIYFILPKRKKSRSEEFHFGDSLMLLPHLAWYPIIP